MKQLINCVALATMLSLASCGGSGDKKGTGADSTKTPEATTTESSDKDKKPEPFTVTGEGWVATDVSKISPAVPITLNLPKDVKMVKEGEEVLVNYNAAMVIAVTGALINASIDDNKLSIKQLDINGDANKNGKILMDEPNGMVFTYQGKDAKDPEYHFVYYLKDKKGLLYRIQDQRPMTMDDFPPSLYTEANAKKLYELVKASAKTN